MEYTNSSAYHLQNNADIQIHQLYEIYRYINSTNILCREKPDDNYTIYISI